MSLPFLIISVLVLFLAVMACVESPANRSGRNDKHGHPTGKAGGHSPDDP